MEEVVENSRDRPHVCELLFVERKAVRLCRAITTVLQCSHLPRSNVAVPGVGCVTTVINDSQVTECRIVNKYYTSKAERPLR